MPPTFSRHTSWTAGAPLRAALFALGSCACFQVAAGATKWLAQASAIPTVEMALVRLGAGVLLVGWGWSVLRSLRDPWLHLVRGILGAVALVALMHAYATLPLFLATTIFYTRVLLMLPVARLFLGERADVRLWMAALIGFAGIPIALSAAARTTDDGWALAAAVVAALASAGSQVTVRRLAQTNPPDVIVIVFALFGALTLTPFVAPVWVTPTWTESLGLLAIAAGGVGAQALLARAYRWGTASYIAPFSFLEIPVSAAIGLALAREVPSAAAILGAALIVGATWFITRTAVASERRSPLTATPTPSPKNREAPHG